MSNADGDPEAARRGVPWSTAVPVSSGAHERPAGAPGVTREPVFRAPGPVILLVALLLGGFALQAALGSETVIERFGFSPASLAQGEWSGLFTAQFVHGGWAHVLMNALGALAFGAPVARLMGVGARGAVAFFAFYLVCGAVGCLGYGLLHPGSEALLIGASGAVAGLMGAASRLIERRPGLAPFTSPTVIGMGAAWIVVNALIAVFGIAPGLGGQPVAWEAHLFGYAAGLLLIWPVAKTLGRLPTDPGRSGSTPV